MYNVLGNLITMMRAVCSKLCGDNVQRSTKQTSLSEQCVHWQPPRLSSSLCQRRQSSHSLHHQSLLCSHEQRSQSMVGSRSWSSNDNLQSVPHQQFILW